MANARTSLASAPAGGGFFDRALGAFGLARKPESFAAAVNGSAGAVPPAGELRGAPDSWGRMMDLSGRETASKLTVSSETAFAIPTAFACINLLSNLVGALPARVIRRTEAGHEDVDSHPVTGLLMRSPNEIQTPFEFRRLMQSRAVGGGYSFARVLRDKFFVPYALVPLAPERVQVLTDNHQARIFYRVANPDGTTEILTRAEVLQINALSTHGFVGLSPVSVLRESYGIAIGQQVAYAEFLANAPFNNSVLTAPSALTPAQIEDFRKQMTAKQGGIGSGNRGTPLTLWGEWKYLAKTSGMNMSDLEFLASRAFENEEICRVFGVHPILVGATEKVSSWGSGIEQINQGFLTYGLNSWLVNWEQALGCTLLTEAERVAGYSVVFDRTELLRTSLQARASFARTMREIDALNVNEVRREFGYNDREGGEKYGVPFTNQGGVATEADADAEDESEKETAPVPAAASVPPPAPAAPAKKPRAKKSK